MASLGLFCDSASHIATVPEWFAVYVRPRHEKRITRHLEMREIDHFLPLYVANRKWKDGSRVTVQLPLFPRYLFVRIHRNKRTRVLEVPGVLFIVGCGRELSRVPDTYIQCLRDGLACARVEPHPYLVAGTRVRVKTGVLRGMEGVLLRRKGSFRVILTLELIKQSVAVEVDVEDIESCAAAHDGAVHCEQPTSTDA